MSDDVDLSRAEQRPSSCPEPEVVKTTIVGGRPPGRGRAHGQVPRGIEVLLKKASVDPDFRRLLLASRGKVADAIGLRLDPVEDQMLSCIPGLQLEAMIAHTKVAESQRAAFLGKAAALMLAAIGVGLSGCHETPPPVGGVRPDPPPGSVSGTGSAVESSTSPAGTQTTPQDPVSQGARPDRPPVESTRGVRPDVPRVEPTDGCRPDLPG